MTIRLRLRLWSAIALTLLMVLLLVMALGFLALLWLGFPHVKVAREEPVGTFISVLKLVFAVSAGIAAVVALVVAYRKQRVTETELFTDRFTRAADQLGSERAAVRLSGVYAMAALADDAEIDGQRQSCIDVLCAYLRMPPPVISHTTRWWQLRSRSARRRPDPQMVAVVREEWQVRHTVIRVITQRLHDGVRGWHGSDFDFTGAVFNGGDFQGAVFSGGSVSFRYATFVGDVRFGGAKFSGGEVSFHGARFVGGEVSFFDAKFSGGSAYFGLTRFSDCKVEFAFAVFSGGDVSFRHATISSGTLGFQGAEFTGGTLGFQGAEFIGGTVEFRLATFSAGLVDFSGAKFAGGTVDLTRPARWDVPPVFGRVGGTPPGLRLPKDWSPPPDDADL